MLPALTDTPRKMFPPPTTTAIWVPSSWACLTSSATEPATLTSMPNDCSPRSASPESLSSTRRKGRELSAAVIGLAKSFGFRGSDPNLSLNCVAKQELETQNLKLETSFRLPRVSQLHRRSRHRAWRYPRPSCNE